MMRTYLFPDSYDYDANSYPLRWYSRILHKMRTHTHHLIPILINLPHRKFSSVYRSRQDLNVRLGKTQSSLCIVS